MRMRFLIAAALFVLPVFANAQEEMLKMPYSVIVSYTAANAPATEKGGGISAEASNLVRRDVVLPLHVGSTPWLVSVSFNSSDALRGKGPADTNLDRVYVTITNTALAVQGANEGNSFVNYVNLFQGEFKLQPGKKMLVYKTADYQIHLTVISAPEKE